MNRRSFMNSILALSMAPAIVRADSLMRIIPKDTILLSESSVESIILEESAVKSGLWPGIDAYFALSYNESEQEWAKAIVKKMHETQERVVFKSLTGHEM